MRLTKLNELIEEGKGLKGQWFLSPDHELLYRADGFDEEYRFKGALIAAEPEALVFSVTERQSDQKIVTSLHRLSGRWRANPKNQIVFEVEKESGKNDVLTFGGGWKLNDNQEILYTFEQTDLKTKRKRIQTLAFSGYWQFSDRHRIVYVLSEDSASAFRFRGAFQTRSILAKKGEIRYQVGIEVSGRRRVQDIVLFGKWKLSRDLGLSFEVDYAGGRRKSIAFGGEYSLDDSRQVAVNLKSEAGKPLGAELIFTKAFFGKDGQAFMRLQKSVGESLVEAGARLRF